MVVLRPSWQVWSSAPQTDKVSSHYFVTGCVSKRGKHLDAVFEGIWRLECSAANNDICHFSAGAAVALQFGHDVCFKLKNN